MSELGEQEGTFSIFFAEGDALAKQGQYKKAIESFTKVLTRYYPPQGLSLLMPAKPVLLLSVCVCDGVLVYAGSGAAVGGPVMSGGSLQVPPPAGGR